MKSIFATTGLLFAHIFLVIVLSFLSFRFFTESIVLASTISALGAGLTITIPIYLKQKKLFKFSNLKPFILIKYFIFLVVFKLLVFLFNTQVMQYEVSVFSRQSILVFDDFQLLKFLSIVIIAPIMEEIIYRGIPTEYLLKNGVSKIAIVLIPSLIFGLSHSLELYGILFFTLFGALLSFVYLGERNIWYCIILHSLYNLFSFFIL